MNTCDVACTGKSVESGFRFLSALETEPDSLNETCLLFCVAYVLGGRKLGVEFELVVGLLPLYF